MDAIEIIQDVLCLTLFGTEIVEMADDLSQLLFSFASYSNFYAIVTILFCFVTTAVLILRFNNDLLHFPVLPPLTPNMAVKQPMTGYTNPFSVQLKDASSTTLKNGFTLTVSSLAEGQLSVFWGPSIDTVHEILQWSGPAVLDSLTRGQLLTGNNECLCSQLDIRLDKDESRDIRIDCPECVDEQTLGYSPRQCYPCVVVAAVSHSGRTEDEIPTVIANFTMIHLRDSIVTLESQLVGQFLKLSDNRIYNLQPVFLATDHAISPGTDASEKDSVTMVTKNSDPTQTSPREGNATSFATTDRLPESTGAICVTTTDRQTETSGDVCLCEEMCDCSKTRPCDSEEMKMCNTVEDISLDDRTTLTSCDKNQTQPDLVSSSTDIQTTETSSRGDGCESSRNSQSLKTDNTETEVPPNNRLENTSVPLATDEMTDNSTQAGQCLNFSSQASGSDRSQWQTSKSPRNDSTSDVDSDEHLETDGPECVVCQMNSISHVILPCRHACICGLCFKKIDRCPMCRGYIDTYFTLFEDGDPDSDSTESEQTDSDETGFVAWITSLNDRLNEYLGLT